MSDEVSIPDPKPWDIPRDWHPERVQCRDCTDTGAVQLDDGTFGVCLCPAGEGLDALDHVARLNDCVQRARELRERMARRGEAA